MRRLSVWLVLLVACGDDEGGVPLDATSVDAPDIDAPDLDAPDLDAPDIDAPDIDAPDIDAPAIDAPAIDAPDLDAPDLDAPAIDAPDVDGSPPDGALPGLHIVTSGLGAGRVTIPGYGFCGQGPCYLGISGTHTLRADPIADSVLVGWSGCTPSGNTCDVTISGPTTVTVTFAPITSPVQHAAWVRTARTAGDHINDIAADNSGVIVAGASPDTGSLWVARYGTDGTPGLSFTDNPTADLDTAVRVAILPGGDVVVLAFIGGNSLMLRRYTPSGSLVWALPPGGFQTRAGLVVDATGNVYVSGLTAAPYIAKYSPAGVQLWRISPAGTGTIGGLAVRGNQLAAVGSQGNLGWIGMFDLDGTLAWSRTTGGGVQFPQLRLHQAAIDSDGDIVFGGDHTGTAPTLFVYGAVGPGSPDPQWVTGQGTRDRGALRVLPDDRVRVFLGYQNVSNMDPARLLDHDEAGALQRTTTMANTQTVGGLDIAPDGATYIAGQSFSLNFPAIERRAGGLTLVTSGLGAGRIDAENLGSCGMGPCFFALPSGTQVTLRQFAIGDSTFGAWSGCTPQAGTCTVTISGDATVSASFAPTTMPSQVAAWIRTTLQPTRPQDLAINGDYGVVVAGYTTTGVPSSPQALWFARYFSDGTLWTNTIDDATPHQDLITRVLVTTDRDFVVAALLAADQPTARVAVRRYSGSGGLQWSVEPGGAQPRVGLARDGSNNIFVSGITGGVPYIAIYTPSGVELDRLTPTGPTAIEGLAVRGAQLAAGGRQDALGWVGMLDLIGNVTWSRTTDGGNALGALGIHEVAIDSDGDIVFGGRNTSPAPGEFIYGAFGSASTTPQWMRSEVQRDRGQLRVLPDDRVLAFIGHNGLASPDHARVLEHAETGGLTRQSSLGLCQAVGGIDVDAAGVTYLAGYAFTSPFPALERRQ